MSAKSEPRDRPTTDLGTKASSSPRASLQAQASPCAESAAYEASGAELRLHTGEVNRMSSSWAVTPQMVSAALAVLRASGRFPYEAEGADQVLMWEILSAARDAGRHGTRR